MTTSSLATLHLLTLYQIVLSQEPVDPEVSSVNSASRAPSVLSTDSFKLTSQTKIVPRKYARMFSFSSLTDKLAAATVPLRRVISWLWLTLMRTFGSGGGSYCEGAPWYLPSFLCSH